MDAADAFTPNRRPDAVAKLARLRRIARLMDSAVGLPGTRFRLGVDGLLGLAPVAGDAVSAAIALYIVWEARRLGAPPSLVARMLGNVALDAFGGSVPLLGDLFDVAFKANVRNVDLLEDMLRRR